MRVFSLQCLAAGAVLMLCGCEHFPPPIPLDQLNAQQMQGHGVFQATCARCHNDRVSQALHGPSLMSMYKRQYLPSGAPANDERVMNTILHGRNLMPPSGNGMEAEDMQDLLAYLHTL